MHGRQSVEKPLQRDRICRTRTPVASGFAVSVIEDACRAIDMKGSAAAARKKLAGAGGGIDRLEVVLGG
jgi:hypothetical protein